MNLKIGQITSILISLFICILPWGFSNQFVQPQNGQLFLFLIFSVFFLILLAIKLLQPSTALSFNITTIDLLLFLFFVIALIQILIQPKGSSLAFILETIGYILLYATVRGINKKYNLLILCSLLVAGIAQAVYGNLQLYGLYPSHHGMFKMTGSFFNPGPYAGYLVSIIPLAIALFLLKYTTWLAVQNKNISGEEVPAPNLSNSMNDPGSMSGFAPKLFFQKVAKIAYQYWPNLLQYLLGITIITALLVLPASKSRAAWLATIGSLLFVLLQMWQAGVLGSIFPSVEKWRIKFLKRLKSPLTRVMIAIIAVALLTGGVFALYQMKQGSVNGRLLIWKVSSEIIKVKPLLGHGVNSFEAKYMDYQAKYFAKNPTSNEIFVADNTKYAFNEFARISVEIGIIGLIICVSIICFALFGKTVQCPSPEKFLSISIRAALIAIMIFSMFSYPAEIVPIKVNFVVLLALLSHYLIPIKILSFTPKIIRIKSAKKQIRLLLNLGRVALAFILIFGTSVFIRSGIKLYQSNKNWKMAFITYQMGAYSTSIKDYEKAFLYLKFNGDFLLNYGKALSMAEEHEKAVEILEYAKNYYPNTILYTALGDSYKALGRTNKAEEAYLHAWHMIPSRFYPKYLLAKLYDETGQKAKAVQVANELLNKEVKIDSKAIEEIRLEMRNIVFCK